MSKACARTNRSGRLGATLVALAVLVAACSSGTDGDLKASDGSTSSAVERTTEGFPVPDWTVVSPADAHLDADVIDQVADEAEQADSGCLVVTRNGELVDERYWNGMEADTSQEVFSATKSYTSMLVGIAQDEGMLDITQSAADFIPEWKGTPAEEVTILDLLSNDSGRHWDYQTDYIAMAGRAEDKTAFAIELEQDDPPGDVWAYNNSAIQTLDAVLEAATGQPPAEFAKQRLLDPIGMEHSEMTTDPAGNTLTFMGLHSTCRDMARFGTLLLNSGDWAGEQIVSSEYVEEATSPSTELNDAYGYLIWLNKRGRLANPIQPTRATDGGSTEDGQMVPDAPEDLFFALGLGNQIILVSPSTGLVITRLGPANIAGGPGSFTQANMARIVTEGVTD